MNVSTSRLWLRDFQPNDTSSLHDLESQTNIAKYQLWEPMTPDGAAKCVRNAIATATAAPRTCTRSCDGIGGFARIPRTCGDEG